MKQFKHEAVFSKDILLFNVSTKEKQEQKTKQKLNKYKT